MADKLTDDEKTQILEKDAVVKLYTIAHMIKCLDAGCSRGTFKGEEMSFVGQLRDVLSVGISRATEIFIEEKENKKKEVLETVKE